MERGYEGTARIELVFRIMGKRYAQEVGIGELERRVPWGEDENPRIAAPTAFAHRRVRRRRPSRTRKTTGRRSAPSPMPAASWSRSTAVGGRGRPGTDQPGSTRRTRPGYPSGAPALKK